MEEPRTLSDRYRLGKHLARGGMADVYEAEDLLLGRNVAVKMLHPQFAADDAFVSRFRREAQAAANLSHPNIVSIYDWGQEDGSYFMVMELIRGRTLRDILKSEGPLLPRRAAEIAAEAAAALEVAHDAGVFHRDIKPGNVMLTGDGSVKVTDFGIARAVDDSEELTRTGAVIGTATYFSPEQAQGIPVDGRSDVYSLGVVLYELLCGRPPFSGESPVAVAYQHVSEYAPDPATVNPDVPPELAAVTMRALEKSPDARYRTAGEFRNDLLRFLRGEMPAAAPAAEAATRLMAGQPPATVPPDETARHVAAAQSAGEQESQVMFIIGIIALFIALAVGVFFLTRILGSSEPVVEVQVPVLADLPAREALETLQDLDLNFRQRDEANETVARGLVITTSPPAGTTVEAGSTVLVIVSSGPTEFPVLNFVGETEDRARELISEQRLLIEVLYQASEEDEAGTVIGQSPDPGTNVAPGTRVTLFVSTGPSSLTVPALAGLTETNALRALVEAGFDLALVDVIEEFSTDVLTGFVIESVPDAGFIVPNTAVVQLVVSMGPEPVAVPPLIGLTPENARIAVEAIGLRMALDPDPVIVTVADALAGLVAAQDPAAGEEREPGDTVTVKLGQLAQVAVPDLTGLTEAEARSTLAPLGLTLEVQGTAETGDPAMVGMVLSQVPAALAEAEDGSIVFVILGVPAPTTTTTTLPPTTTTTVPPTTTTTVPPTTTTTAAP